jgi:hypothetical protein
MNYTIIANSGFYSISGKDIDFFTSFLSAEAGSFIMADSYAALRKGVSTGESTYAPFESCGYCGEFDPEDPFEENDVDPYVDCEEFVVTDPYASCSDDEVIFNDASSPPYPTVLFESTSIASFSVISADMHRSFLEEYTPLPDESEITNFYVDSGIFRAMVLSYLLGDDSEIKDFEVISGIFRQMVLLTSTAEDSEITDFEVTSGVFSKVVIDYTYGLPENSEIKNFSVTGGVHATV